MSCSPGSGTDTSPLLQLQEVGSSKATERGTPPGLLHPIYSPPVGRESHTVCIPSPYTDSSHEYSHGTLAFYSPSMLSYGRPPVSDSPSSICPPLSPSLFWPPPHGHHNVPSLTLHCPQPLVYGDPHPPWVQPKAHGLSPSRYPDTAGHSTVIV